ncbi:MAG: bifunctional indole-3-glycerol phosphate synthase/phosphoribosylanthranilate isomerase, partial [Alphaproteobacteria bacterium]
FGGLVMVAGTPRAVDGARAEALAGAARACGLALVGVFRDEDAMEVAVKARTLGLAAVQLHGEEDAGYIRRLRGLLPEGVEIWAAGAVGETVPEPRAGADRVLFDTAVGGRSGGTGTTFDWALLDKRGELDRSILAGGLNAGNAFAASRVGAYALDVGSGVEGSPGRKDGERLRAFFEALRVPVRGEIG